MSKIRPGAREAILEAAFQTFSQQPTASLADVAKHAGVGRATLHRHFKSRETLMIALAQTATQELDEAIDAATAGATSHTEGLRLAFGAMIPLADRQWFLAHEPVDRDPEIAKSYQAGREELAASIEAAKSEGTFSKDISTTWIVEAYENLVYAAWTMVRDGHATPGQATDLAWRTLTTGMTGESK